jgi:hypothetical protein
MTITTQRDAIKMVAFRWERQYSTRMNEMLGWMHKTPREVHAELLGLNLDTATAEDIEKIIGNGSWTRLPECGECGQQTDVIVRVGEEPDYESQTAHLCPSCVRRAAELVAHLP